MRDLIALDDSSKVWLYQANRAFTDQETNEIKEKIFQFVQSWSSHNRDLMAYGNLFHYRYIGLFVDESQSMASGCSIDTSNHFVQSLGQEYGVDFFDRMLFTYMQDEKVYDIHSSKMKDAYTSGRIDKDTLFFNNLVKDKGEFLTKWIYPLEESWHYRFVM